MKRIAKLVVALLFMAIPSASFAETSFLQDGPTNPSEIAIRKLKDKSKIKEPRDLSPDVRAFLSDATIFVDLFEAGPTTVYVLDSRNRVVASETSEGYEYESLILQVPSAKGTYTLVVWGTYLYGEGTFTVE